LHGTSDFILAIRGLCVETLAGNLVIDQVSLQVRRGEVLALVGESGSGKTTLAIALLGHNRNGTQITGGSVEFDGIDILKLSPDALQKIRGARISYVPQDPTSGLNPRHRVGDQLSEMLLVHGGSREAAHHATVELLQRVGLPADPNFIRRYPFELSGGQQQRIAIAMALACKPAIVVLDEPTTGLDVTTQARVLQLIRELNRETNAAFIYVTHDLAVVDSLADRVCIMYAGRIVEKGMRTSNPTSLTSMMFGAGTPQGHPLFLAVRLKRLRCRGAPRLSFARNISMHPTGRARGETKFSLMFRCQLPWANVWRLWERAEAERPHWGVALPAFTLRIREKWPCMTQRSIIVCCTDPLMNAERFSSSTRIPNVP
jgi:ABC-type dipeptide/oligopeptide/nickel transport system ATPase component